MQRRKSDVAESNFVPPFPVNQAALPTITSMLKNLVILVLLCSCVFALPLRAQFSSGQLPFGKNKVQYQEFNWKYYQTSNFDVYFHQGGDYVARYTANQAEKALSSIQSTLSYTITKRIVLIVYNSHNQFQQTNVLDEYMSEGIGGVTELFKNRIVIPFEGNYQKFKHVIHHELVHAVLNDMFYGGSIQSLINNNAIAMIPTWMNEGFAEWESTGGLDVKTDEFMRDVAVSEYLKGLYQLNGYFAYRGGQSFWWYVAEKYGKGKVGEVFNRFRSIGDVNQTFKAAFGMTYEEMSEQWAKDLKKFYFPDVDRYEYVEDFSTRLSNHQKENNFYNTSPALSPDGERVAYISDRDDVFSLYVMDISTKKTKRLRSSARSVDFEELNLLTPGISWNPQGTKLAVGAKSGGEDAIFIIDVKSGNYDKIDLGFKTIGGVQWSPDGTTLAFDAAPGEAQSDIFVYDLKRKTTTSLTHDIFSDMEPVWSPDGDWLYFISDRASYTSGDQTTENFSMWEHDVSQRDIYRVNVNTQVIERITNEPSIGKYSIAVAPDHKTILYVADYNGIGNLWELNIATNERRARTNSLQEISQISLSKDGTKLAFASQNRVGYDIFLLKFPFEQKERDTLPMTKFRKQELDERASLASIITTKDATRKDSVESFGEYDIDFSRQSMVKPKENVKASETGPSKNTTTTTTSTAKDYRVTFTPDVITGSAGYSNWFGAQGVIQMLFSDMLGDHSIYVAANLFLDLSNSNLFVQYSYLPKIVDYSIAGFHNAGYSYISSGQSTFLYRMRNYGATGTASYPFSRYSRFDVGLSGIAMSRENLDVPQDPSLSRFVVVPTLAYVYDNTLNGLWAPSDGTRWNTTVEASPKLSSSSGLGFVTLRTDIRHYIGLGNNYTIALRGSGGYSTGPDPQKFFIGGVDNWFNRSFSANGWPFVEPEDFAFTRPVWPLRGYAINEQSGSRFAQANVEFRFPLLFAIQAGPLPALFQGLQGQIFFDIGRATGDLNRPSTPTVRTVFTDKWLYSTGVGIRSVLLGLPFRFDVAWRHQPWGGMSEPYYLYSLGMDF